MINNLMLKIIVLIFLSFYQFMSYADKINVKEIYSKLENSIVSNCGDTDLPSLICLRLFVTYELIKINENLEEITKYIKKPETKEEIKIDRENDKH
jgi:hypothetical protein